jgi:hypothetical protein
MMLGILFGNGINWNMYLSKRLIAFRNMQYNMG